MYPPRKRSSSKKFIFIAAIILVLGAAGFAGWYVLSGIEQSNDEDTVEEQVAEDTDTEEEAEFEEYSADNPSLSFAHPSTWEVREEDETVYIESPSFSYQTVDGQEVEGYFRVFMRQTARDEDSAYIARGVASQASETLVYEEPSVNQREETNLSFFGIDEPDRFNFLLIAGNFSLEPGDILGGSYGQEEGTYLFGGGYSSDELDDTFQMHPVSLDQFEQHPVYEEALDILRSIRIG